MRLLPAQDATGALERKPCSDSHGVYTPLLWLKFMWNSEPSVPRTQASSDPVADEHTLGGAVMPPARFSQVWSQTPFLRAFVCMAWFVSTAKTLVCVPMNVTAAGWLRNVPPRLVQSSSHVLPSPRRVQIALSRPRAKKSFELGGEDGVESSAMAIMDGQTVPRHTDTGSGVGDTVVVDVADGPEDLGR